VLAGYSLNPPFFLNVNVSVFAVCTALRSIWLFISYDFCPDFQSAPDNAFFMNNLATRPPRQLDNGYFLTSGPLQILPVLPLSTWIEGKLVTLVQECSPPLYKGGTALLVALKTHLVR